MQFQNEKDEILHDYDESQKIEKNLSFYNLLLVYICMVFVFFLTLPTIYIRNEIYYISRKIADLRTKHDVLLEENRELQNKIEYIKYKYEILDQVNTEVK